MKVSKKAYYGLRALAALAHHMDGASAHVLAVETSIPEDYLQKILQHLKRAGFIAARKGVSGGYRLAHPAAAITSWRVIETLDGGFETPERSVFVGTLTPCPIVTHCQTKSVWEQLEGSVRQTLSHITLADLVPKQ